MRGQPQVQEHGEFPSDRCFPTERGESLLRRVSQAETGEEGADQSLQHALVPMKLVARAMPKYAQRRMVSVSQVRTKKDGVKAPPLPHRKPVANLPKITRLGEKRPTASLEIGAHRGGALTQVHARRKYPPDVVQSEDIGITKNSNATNEVP